MKTKLFISIIIIINLFSCTNPEVEFPKETKIEEKKSNLVIKNPVIFLYDEPLSPLSFYYIITAIRSNGSSESMLRPVKIDNLITDIESMYQFYGLPVSIVSFGKEIKEKIKDEKYKNYINKYIYVGNPKCIKEEYQKEIEIIKLDEKEECKYEPLNYLEKLKDSEFIKNIIKKISEEGEITSIAFKEEVILLKGKTYPELDINLISLDENKQEKVIFKTKSDIGGYFGPIILTPKEKIKIKLTKQDFTFNISLLGITNSYSYLELLPELESVYIKLIFSKLKTDEVATSLKIKLRDEDKELNVNTIIIKTTEKNDESYKIEKNIFYIFNPQISDININGIKIDLKNKGAYYVF
ncbi:MAG TPA: hypothetical protein PKW55_02545 [Spirochaetota bacterium]|nr:hypothetical protein [Spirochaetota bacterium]HOM38272.1 hypothetical protein [Spirochaetota bacterium]HPQ48510.1 hypothetical protein [Spirochaetota bacterium]